MFGLPGMPATSSTLPANIAGPTERQCRPATSAGSTGSAAPPSEAMPRIGAGKYRVMRRISEPDLQPKLQVARTYRCRGGLSKRRGRDIDTGRIAAHLKYRVIERVQRFQGEPHADGFANWNVLDQRNIGLHVSGPVQENILAELAGRGRRSQVSGAGTAIAAHQRRIYERDVAVRP